MLLFKLGQKISPWTFCNVKIGANLLHLQLVLLDLTRGNWKTSTKLIKHPYKGERTLSFNAFDCCSERIAERLVVPICWTFELAKLSMVGV